MNRLVRLFVLRLLLAVGLCLAPLAGSDALYAQSSATESLTNAAHHQERDSSSEHPICALVRCECHACPHLAVTTPSNWAIGPDLTATLLRNDPNVTGAVPEVEPPPPRTSNIDMV